MEELGGERIFHDCEISITQLINHKFEIQKVCLPFSVAIELATDSQFLGCWATSANFNRKVLEVVSIFYVDTEPQMKELICQLVLRKIKA